MRKNTTSLNSLFHKGLFISFSYHAIKYSNRNRILDESQQKNKVFSIIFKHIILSQW